MDKRRIQGWYDLSEDHQNNPKKIQALAVEYALKYNKHGADDVVQTSKGLFKIKSVITSFDLFHNVPINVYECQALTKSGKLKKSKAIHTIFEYEIIIQ